MRTTPADVCLNCVHYTKPRSDYLILDHIKGECRRYPPLIIKATQDEETMQITSEAVWPRVEDNDYCGEFK